MDRKLLEDVTQCTNCKSRMLVQYSRVSDQFNAENKEVLSKLGLNAQVFTILECQICKLQMLSPRWTANGIQTFYEEWYKVMLERKSTYVHQPELGHFNWVAQSLLSEFPLAKALKVLDIGCGVGDFLDAFHRLSPQSECYGLELNKEASTIARSKGHKIYNCSVEDFQSEDSYDLIVFNSLIEHLIDPFTILDKFYIKLSPGGMLYFNVPSSESLNSKISKLFHKPSPEHIVEHLHYFPPRIFTNRYRARVFYGNLWPEPGPIGRRNKIVRLLLKIWKSKANNISVLISK